MDKNNYRKAGFIVGLASLGFLIAYPYHENFWGGLISSACSAAMIGGLADWFAVTALFRRPLGIRPGKIIRTEIIPRNRERIFAALADMVQNDLLSSRAIKQRLQGYNILELLLNFLDKQGGREEIHSAIEYILRDLFKQVSPVRIKQLIVELLAQDIPGVKVSSFLLKLLNFSLDHGYDQKLVDIGIDQLIAALRHPQANSILFQIVKEAIEAYENGMDRRKFVNGVILQLSPISLTELIQGKLVELLVEIRQTETHPLRLKLKEKLVSTIERLQGDEQFQRQVQSWAIAHFASFQLERSKLVARLDDPLTDSFSVGKQITSWVQSQAVEFELKLQQSEQLRLDFDALIKQSLVAWLEEGHRQIGALVKDNLARLNEQELVDLIEKWAGNDLQIIRINGTVVGGLVGILIYLLDFWLGLG